MNIIYMKSENKTIQNGQKKYVICDQIGKGGFAECYNIQDT